MESASEQPLDLELIEARDQEPWWTEDAHSAQRDRRALLAEVKQLQEQVAEAEAVRDDLRAANRRLATELAIRRDVIAGPGSCTVVPHCGVIGPHIHPIVMPDPVIGHMLATEGAP